MMHAMYDTLIRPDQNGNPIPDLASSWTFKNETTLDLNLVQNATWHDGQPFTSDDVVFTIDLYMAHPEFPLMNLYVQNIQSIAALDRYTVEIRLKQVDATFIDYATLNLYMLPKHIWQNVANYTTFTNANPVGSGPFIFQSWGGPNTNIDYKANTNYFGPKPKYDNLVISYFTSYSAMALALQAGQIDYGGPLIPPALISQLSSTPGVQLIEKPEVRYNHLYFNIFPTGSGNPTLRDRVVRIALAHAVNNTELCLAALEGYCATVNVPMPASLTYWINPNIKPYDFNLAEAAQLLDQAGYKKGSDGIRASPTGVRMSYTIEIPSDYTYLYRAAQIVAGYWKQIGIDATAQILDVTTLANNNANWQFDAQMWTWSAGYTIDPDWFCSTLLSSQASPAPNPGLSDSGFMNATYDALYLQQKSETDPAKRQQIIWQMQEIVHEQVPYIPLFSPLAIQGYRSDRWTGVPNGNLPPLGQFYTNNLMLGVTPVSTQSSSSSVAPMTNATAVVATNSTAPPTGLSTGAYAAIAVLALVVIVIAALVMRKKHPTTPK